MRPLKRIGWKKEAKKSRDLKKNNLHALMSPKVNPKVKVALVLAVKSLHQIVRKGGK